MVREENLFWTERPGDSEMYTSWVAPITCTRDRQYVILHCRPDPEVPHSGEHYSVCQQNHRTGFYKQIAICATLGHAQNWAHDDYIRYGYKRKDREKVAR